MSVTVAVAGASGYAGGEILRLLVDHPALRSGELKIGPLAAGSSAGMTLREHHPHLVTLADRTLVPTTAEELRGADVVFLGLPHGHSAALAAELPEETILIDCGADFRLRSSEDWDHWYGGTWAGTWTYGIPELPGQRKALTGATRIAGPGCFPSGVSLATVPALAAGFIRPDVTIVSVTGASGAGRAAKPAMLGSEVMGSARAYGVGGTHRHTPEIRQILADVTEEEVTVSFTPVLAPMARGILSTIAAPLVDPATPAKTIREAYTEAYADEPFVHVLPLGNQPATKSVVGSNCVHIAVEVDEISGRLVLTSAIDNLTKGTGGAAVQCMNIALGWEETAGLPVSGLAP